MIPCPMPNCKAPITHWHDLNGYVSVCGFALRGEPCTHDDGPDLPCYAPRETTPLLVPDVDTTARVIYEIYYALSEWDDESDLLKDEYRRAAQVVLDLIANCQSVWKRVEPGTRVEAGQRCRVEYADGDATEYSSSVWWIVMDDNSTTTYVLSTPPTPETRDSIIREFAAELDSIYTERTAGDGTWVGVLDTLVNRLDALGGESA